MTRSTSYTNLTDATLARLGDPSNRRPERDSAGRELVEDSVDQRLLDRHARVVTLVVLVERLANRRARAGSIEVLDAKVRVEQRGDEILEHVEPREHVLADRDEEARRPLDTVDGLCQLLLE